MQTRISVNLCNSILMGAWFSTRNVPEIICWPGSARIHWVGLTVLPQTPQLDLGEGTPDWEETQRKEREKEGAEGKKGKGKKRKGKGTRFHTGISLFPILALCNYINSGAKHIKNFEWYLWYFWRLKCIKWLSLCQYNAFFACYLHPKKYLE